MITLLVVVPCRTPVSVDRLVEPLDLVQGRAEVVGRDGFTVAIPQIAVDPDDIGVNGDGLSSRPCARRAVPRFCNAMTS